MEDFDDVSCLEAEEELSERYVKYLRLLSSSWSTHRAARMLTGDLLRYIRPRFVRCSTPLKVRVIVSLLHMREDERLRCIPDLVQFLKQCELDSEDWVRKLSRLLLPFARNGTLDSTEIDTEFAYRTLQFLDERREENGVLYHLKPPLERSDVFDALQEKYIPLEEATYMSYEAAAAQQQQPFGFDTATRHFNQRGFFLSVPNTFRGGMLPPKLAEYLLTLPLATPDTTHFTPMTDLAAAGNDLCTSGLAILAREWQTDEMASRRREKRATERGT